MFGTGRSPGHRAVNSGADSQKSPLLSGRKGRRGALDGSRTWTRYTAATSVPVCGVRLARSSLAAPNCQTRSWGIGAAGPLRHRPRSGVRSECSRWQERPGRCGSERERKGGPPEGASAPCLVRIQAGPAKIRLSDGSGHCRTKSWHSLQNATPGRNYARGQSIKSRAVSVRRNPLGENVFCQLASHFLLCSGLLGKGKWHADCMGRGRYARRAFRSVPIGWPFDGPGVLSTRLEPGESRWPGKGSLETHGDRLRSIRKPHFWLIEISP